MPVASLSRVNQALMMVQLLSKWGERHKANNPLLVAKMAEAVAALMFAGAQVNFKNLAIRQQATGNVLRNMRLDAFLSGIPDSGAALLVFNGPECTSVMKSNGALFAQKHVNRTVWIACCMKKRWEKREGVHR